jgi:hypothetical protein
MGLNLAVCEETSEIQKYPGTPSNEVTNLSKRLGSSLVDDDMFWLYFQNLHELIHPIIQWIFLLEYDSATSSRVPQCLS